MLTVPCYGDWVRAQTKYFDLVSDGGTRSARQTVADFDTIRQILSATIGDHGVTATPARILAVGGPQARLLHMHPNEGGYYVSGGFGDTIVVFLGSESYRVVFHEYVHLFLNRSGLVLPLWLNEGISELFSTGRIGSPLPQYLALLRAGAWMPLPNLLAIARASREYTGADAPLFYAESWALTHMLALSRDYKAGFPAVLAGAAAGRSMPSTLESVYKRSLTEILNDLNAYVNGPMMSVRPPVAVHVEKDSIHLTTLEEPSAALTIADVLGQIGKASEIEAVFRKLESKFPDHPDVKTGLAEVAMRNGDVVGAKRYLEQAVESRSRSVQPYYDLAVVIRDDPNQQRRFRELLRQAIALDPSYFNAQYLLGYTELRAGNFQAAVPALAAAAQLAPSRAPVWEQLAMAKQGANDREGALAAARQARHVAASEAERDRLDAMLAALQDRPAANPAPAADRARVAPSDSAAPNLRAPRSDASISGTLTQVDCLDTAARLTIATASGRMFLLVRDPGSVLMKGSVSTTIQLACGPVSPPRQVDVAYRRQPDTRYQTAGDVTEIDLK